MMVNKFAPQQQFKWRSFCVRGFSNCGSQWTFRADSIIIHYCKIIFSILYSFIQFEINVIYQSVAAPMLCTITLFTIGAMLRRMENNAPENITAHHLRVHQDAHKKKALREDRQEVDEKRERNGWKLMVWKNSHSHRIASEAASTQFRWFNSFLFNKTQMHSTFKTVLSAKVNRAL